MTNSIDAAEDALTISLDDGPTYRARWHEWEHERVPGPSDGLFVTYLPGPVTWTIVLDGHVGRMGVRQAARFTVNGRTYRGTSEVDTWENSTGDPACRTTLIVYDVREVETP